MVMSLEKIQKVKVIQERCYILCKFAWKCCIFIGLQERNILVCHPLERVIICLFLTLWLSSTGYILLIVPDMKSCVCLMKYENTL